MLTGSSQLTRGTLGGSDIRAGLCRFIPACAGNSYERKKVTEYTSVHPRLRGELLWSKIISNNAVRFIPAYAGNSSAYLFLVSSFSVHPRLRGELTATLLCCLVKCGSSPLTRGTRKKARNGKRFDWFIPAYAGNSSIAWMSSMTESVHPRLRGELGNDVVKTAFRDGSSPLTRGTRQLVERDW